MNENYINKEVSKEVFNYDENKISLKEYQDDLVFYWSGEEDQAEYALSNKSPEFDKKPVICQNGKFGNYSKISGNFSFDQKNFESLTDNLHLSFYLGANSMNGKFNTTFSRKNNWENETTIERLSLSTFKDTFEKGQSTYTFNRNVTSVDMTYSQGTATFDVVLDDINKTIKLTPKNYAYSTEPMTYNYEEFLYGYKLTSTETVEGYPQEINLDLVDKMFQPGDYSINFQVAEEVNKTLILHFDEPSTFANFKNKLLFELDPAFYNIELLKDDENSFTLACCYPGKTVKYYDGQDGINILSVFEITDEQYGTYPIEDIDVVSLIGEKEKLTITHTNDEGISKLRFVLKQNDLEKITSINWNNNGIDLDNIEVDIDSSVMYIFLNGSLKKAVLISPIKMIKDKMTLLLKGTEQDPYSFEEIIVKNKLQNKEDFIPSESQLTKYDTTIPFIDFFYLSKNINKNSLSELLIEGTNNLSFVLNYGGKFYYYNSGSWRKSDGSFMESNDQYVFSDQIKNFEFTNDENLFIRVYFNSDGNTESWLKNLYFKISDKDILGDGTLVPAILVGENQYEDKPEPPDPEKKPINLKGKTLLINTDQGKTEIKFEEDLYVNEAVDLINSKFPIGIAEAKKDSMGRVVLISETKGEPAYITVGGDAAFLLFGKEITANGDDEGKGTLDGAYSDFIDKVLNYINDDLIPTEVSEKSIRLYLQEAINLYKRYRSEELNTYHIQLNGNVKDGYEIPPVIEDWHDITDIIFRPIFPIGFYTGGFDNDAEDIISLTLVNTMMGRGSPNYGSFYGKNFTQDFYISLMNIQDMEQTLGIKPSWRVYNGRLFIFPNDITKYLTVTLVYKAPIDPNDALKDPFIIQYVSGKIRQAQGMIRGQFGSQLSAGQNIALNMNSDSMYERGRQMCEEALAELKKLQQPLGFVFG